jgi:hypothetical protein
MPTWQKPDRANGQPPFSHARQVLLDPSPGRRRLLFLDGVFRPWDGRPTIGTAFSANPQYDFSALGTEDWAHWGRGGVYTNSDRKSSGGAKISNVAKVGAWSGGAAKASVYSAN